ncbi:ATEXPA16 [Hibiscus syriacus]|uniref:ATEXPA16 n=1 Tax=Hibiscus syriacus TaxID=106335 RepID=A0A6A2ZEU8_HIBSY|nr:ATEXPA16 [Hibiscus syriacus]
MADYYNSDDILAEEEFVPVVFHKAANGVIIDPSSETNSVEQGAKVELPLWLAQELYLRQAISISVPACFIQRYIDDPGRCLNPGIIDVCLCRCDCRISIH